MLTPYYIYHTNHINTCQAKVAQQDRWGKTLTLHTNMRNIDTLVGTAYTYGTV